MNTDSTDPALAVVGVALVALGLAHALLPRALGWTRDTHRDAGALGALVVRMHVYSVGAFLVIFGVLSVVVAVASPSPTGQVFLVAAALLFLLRWLAEVVAVGRVVRGGATAVVWLHRFALVGWLSLVVVYARAFIVKS